MNSGAIHLLVQAELSGGSELEDGIADALRGDGFVVETPSRGVTRSEFPTGAIMVQILDAVEGHLVDAAIGAVVASLAPRLGQLRKKRVERVAILGPRGETLRTIELPDSEDAPPP